MFFWLTSLLSRVLFMVLNVNSGSFPKPLSAAEERECLRLMKNGDAAARGKLIEHNLRLVAHIVKKYYAGAGGDGEDLISIGTIGLIKAIDTFDCDKSIRLSGYAARCIENEVLMHFRNEKKTAQNISLSEPIDTDSEGNALTLMDILCCEDTVADDLDTKIKTEHLHRFLTQALDRRELKIVRLRYGLTGDQPLTQQEVAEKLNISRSYVSRLEKRALEKLRARFESAPKH